MTRQGKVNKSPRIEEFFIMTLPGRGRNDMPEIFRLSVNMSILQYGERWEGPPSC